MSAEAYSDLVGRFQFITGYPYVLALTFNALRRRDANLFQGSLTLQASSEGVSRWKLLIFTLAWDTPLMVCLALFIARDQGAQGQAILVVQALSCLYIVGIAGLLFPTIDPAIILVNFCTVLRGDNFGRAAGRPNCRGDQVLLLQQLGTTYLIRPGRIPSLPWFRRKGPLGGSGMSGFLLAITLSVVETLLIGFLPR